MCKKYHPGRVTKTWQLEYGLKPVNRTRLGKLVRAGQPLKCVICGAPGHVVKQWVDPINQGLHHDVFTKNGMMLTQDHILPKSLGGNDSVENLRIMCASHNSKRGNKTSSKDIQWILKNLPTISVSTELYKFSYRLMGVL